MTKHPTLIELLVRQQNQTRLAQRIAGAMAILWLALTATMFAGWMLTW
jgi:hypothetical protein